jgi:hypothetical protein
MLRVVADANVLVSAAIARSPQAPSVLTLDRRSGKGIVFGSRARRDADERSDFDFPLSGYVDWTPGGLERKRFA